MTENAQRLERLWEAMDARGVDLMFLPPQTDLEYFTGLKRRVPSFGNIGYTSNWVAGAFIAPGQQPLFVLPRMITEFDLPDGVDGEIVTVSETDDAVSLFTAAMDRVSLHPRRVAIGERAWADTVLRLRAHRPDAETVSATELINPLRRIKSAAELELMRQAAVLVDTVLGSISPSVVAGITELELASEIDFRMRETGSIGASFDTGVWSMGPGVDRDATVRISNQPLKPGSGVSFDFGAVVDGYCSDFGRTIHIGEPDDEYERVYDMVMAAQAAGAAAVRPGATAADVHRATRAVIVEGGYGEWFRHRTGHCIGKDVHELPYISEEDDTVLEPGMAFTIEPSVFWPGRVGVRVEDIFVCTESGVLRLNEYPTTLVAH
jgi:Xaa-Pro aminopeptidase